MSNNERADNAGNPFHIAMLHSFARQSQDTFDMVAKIEKYTLKLDREDEANGGFVVWWKHNKISCAQMKDPQEVIQLYAGAKWVGTKACCNSTFINQV